jgi:pyridinium-3,5-biscarboxylic acid mononucleotide synthase
MNRERLRDLLARVASGALSVDGASAELAELPFEDLGFAKLDHHRELRSGLPEAVYASGKSDDALTTIVERLFAAQGRALATRVSPEQATLLRARFPEARYGETSRVWRLGTMRPLPTRLAILSAGTSDAPVAEEAADCAEWCGLAVDRHPDVGVAGVHRLFDCLERVRAADVVVAVAGMDGALPTLVAGLVAAPVIAVPTSVGYGAAFGGLAALLTMLNACAPGIAVVNIDNGYGAAVLAHRIASANIASP